jgi:RNA polymerase sigma-70 factor (ECF subfamily)
MHAALLNPHGRVNHKAYKASWPRGRARMSQPSDGAKSPGSVEGAAADRTSDAQRFSADIVAIAERGDRAAFESLFKYFAPRVKSYLLRLGAPAEAAEELAQETLLTVWRRAAAFNPALAGASTWIFTIARNLRIDLARRAARQSLPDDPGETVCQDPAPDAALSALEDEVRIKHALTGLPEEQVRVITLAFFADKPHAEIALDLGLPLGTVKSRLRLAMARLRAALDDRS